MTRARSVAARSAGILHYWKQPSRPLRWSPLRAGVWHTAPLTCPEEQWYAAHFRCGAGRPPPALTVRFFRGGRVASQLCPALTPIRAADDRHWMGWFQAPRWCKRFDLELSLGDAELMRVAPEIHAVGERDAKCHPTANVPRWSGFRSALAVEKLWIPAGLEALVPLMPELRVCPLDASVSFAKLDALARGHALIVNRELSESMNLNFAGLSRLASHALVLVDLEAFLAVLTHEGFGGLSLGDCRCAHSLTTARVVYSDVATRGFALMDTFPYGEIDDVQGFVQRAIVGKPAWKRFADATACAMLLESQTHSSARSGHVLCAAQPIERGELICTDLPRLAALPMRRQLAPRLTRHCMRTMLGLPVPDHYQYWNRWDEAAVVVRDIAEVGRKYAPLRALRWGGDGGGVARLGIELQPMERSGPLRRVVLETGRIDQLEPHDGVPPEPMMILMKWLAREARERADWVRRELADTSLVWRFEAGGGTKYVSQYDSAALMSDAPAGERVVSIRQSGLKSSMGLFGDGSFEMLDELCDILREACSRRETARTSRVAEFATVR